METTTARFAGFSDDELRVMWAAMEGIRHRVLRSTASDTESKLAYELDAEGDRRHLGLPDPGLGAVLDC